MNSFARLSWTAFITLITSSCTTPTTPSGNSTAAYTAFDAWRTSNRITPYAACGSARALHDLFVITYARASDPNLGGEDLEQMGANLAQVATGIGDASFAEALKRERPEIVNAVRLIGEGLLSEFPQTSGVIRSAPRMILPMEHASNNVQTALIKALVGEASPEGTQPRSQP